MSIIRANACDLPVLVPLFEAYRQFYRREPDPAGAMAFLRQRLEKEDSVIFLTLLEDGTAAGFTQLYPLFSSVRMRKLWLLNDLFVDEAYRGRRLSLGLIEQAKRLAQATGAAGLILETEKGNAIGNQLYPRTGFLRSEQNYYHWDCPTSEPVTLVEP